MRRILHSIFVGSQDCIGKLKWVKSDRSAKATLLIGKKKPKKKRKIDCREIIVVVPASWQFLEKIEGTREDLEEERIGALINHWHFWEFLSYSGLDSEIEQDGAHLATIQRP